VKETSTKIIVEKMSIQPSYLKYKETRRTCTLKIIIIIIIIEKEK